MRDCLARYYIINQEHYELAWFDDQPFRMIVVGCCWLVSFLNIGRGVLSSNENFLLFGANCKEDCVKNLYTFSVDCNGKSVDVKFRISELPFLAGELLNSATYFSTFANVSKHNMTGLDGTHGCEKGKMWRPWEYQDRVFRHGATGGALAPPLFSQDFLYHFLYLWQSQTPGRSETRHFAYFA